MCRPRGVYPRVCGGTVLSVCSLIAAMGLSPRVRGNRPAAGPHRRRPGSIPACAGEPAVRMRQRGLEPVYPRVCGGTWAHLTRKAPMGGLSPRVRGNPAYPPSPNRPARSIPACAGEPRRWTARAGYGSVYPRVCGGTPWLIRRGRPVWGLSPRVRGNLIPAAAGMTRMRSIPACAGEPTPVPSPASAVPVYPRVCGGTSAPPYRRAAGRGLSPRVRGNLAKRTSSRRCGRSIPACAGEPDGGLAGQQVGRVYPRVCGGTASSTSPGPMLAGLSPRVRGNLTQGFLRLVPLRSIPACAGEPAPASQLPMRQWVYPRVCGGTGGDGRLPASGDGLSPRVRGNLPRQARNAR